MKTNNEPESILKKYFGYKSFRYGQKEVIENILSGRDTLCIMPTSGGKSICYEVPSLIFPGITLCISPLISLMKDQVENLKEKGIKAAYVNSTLDSKDIYYTLKNAACGKYSFLDLYWKFFGQYLRLDTKTSCVPQFSVEPSTLFVYELRISKFSLTSAFLFNI